MTSERLEYLLRKVTQGEWALYGTSSNQTVGVSSVNRVCFLAHSNGLNDDTDTANATLIALSPSLARRVISAEKLVEAGCKMADAIEAGNPFSGNVEIWDTALTAYREASK